MNWLNTKTPNVTLAQAIAALGWVITQAIAMGWLDGDKGQLFLQLGSSIIAGLWMVGDGILRAGRNRARAAAIQAGNPDPALTPSTKTR